jgi:hypothetical protein
VKETLIREEYSHAMAVASEINAGHAPWGATRAFTIQNGLFCKGYAVDQRLSIHCSRQFESFNASLDKLIVSLCRIVTTSPHGNLAITATSIAHLRKADCYKTPQAVKNIPSMHKN